MKIIFISPSITAVHIRKRVQGFVDAGYDVVLYAFDRGDSASKDYPPQVEVINLGFTPSGSGYLKKIVRYVPILRRIFGKYTREDVIYFVCAFDLALICRLCAGKPYFYHISDLVYGYFDKRIQWIFRIIDRFIIRSSVKTVVTSNGFREYLSTSAINSKFIYQPNNLSSYFKYQSMIGEKKDDITSLKFAFIGFVRFEAIYHFARVIGGYFPQHSFHFYGKALSMSCINSLVERYGNIKYHGAFRSPDDLNEIYGQIDVVVSCYDVCSLNVRLAEPNKLFEAAFFKKPIIVSDETFLQKRVMELGSGYSVDSRSEIDIKKFISSLTVDSINQVIERLNKIDSSVLIDDNSKSIIKACDEFRIQKYK